MSNNKHVVDYLAYYAAFAQPPGFAVLVNGPWGIGKTHVIDAFLKSVKTPDFQTVYVSLNGLKSFEEIDRELFRVMHTVLGNKFFGAAVNLGKAGLKAMKGISLDINVLDLVNRYVADLYVFDDLERCSMPAVQVLGYINAFVEHGKRKVIVIANEDEIKEAEYGRTREKVVGQILAVHSAVNAALATFVSKIEPPARNFLATKSEVIVAIYEQGDHDNLRLLQQGLWDFARFYAALDDRHRADDGAMTAMLRLLLALAMEIRAHRLERADLIDRKSTFLTSMLNRNATAEQSPFLEARQRYAGADLDSRALSDATIVALLIDGVVDPDAIRRDLDASTYFVVVDEEPAWRTLWYGLERTDDEVAAALLQVETDFAERAYTVPGEILHVFGLRLNLARHGVIPKTLAEVAAECQAYIDDLYATKRLEPTPPHGGPSALRESGYGGLQIVASETPEYRVLFRSLEDKRAQASVDRYPAQAAELLSLLRATPDQFIDVIAPGRGQQTQYTRVPVLAQMPPEAFVTTLLAQRPSVQRQLLTALETRYEHRLLQGELASELPWAEAVRDQLAGATATMTPFGRYRIEMFVAQSFGRIPDLAPPPPGPVSVTVAQP